jgi:hypothetical protein
MILIQSQPVFALSPLCYTFSGEATNTNLWTFIRPDRGSNPQLTALEASTLTSTSPMRFFFKYIGASCDKYAKLEMETEQYLQLCQALKANQK